MFAEQAIGAAVFAVAERDCKRVCENPIEESGETGGWRSATPQLTKAKNMFIPIRAPDECQLGVMAYKCQRIRIALAESRKNCFAARRRIDHFERTIFFATGLRVRLYNQIISLARRDQMNQLGLITAGQQQLKAAERVLTEFEASLLPQDDDDGIEWPGG